MGIDDGSRGGISLRLMNDLDGFLLIRFVSSIFHTHQIESSIFLENEIKLNENSSMMDKMVRSLIILIQFATTVTKVNVCVVLFFC